MIDTSLAGIKRQIQRTWCRLQSKVLKTLHGKKRVVRIRLEIAEFDFDRVFRLVKFGAAQLCGSAIGLFIVGRFSGYCAKVTLAGIAWITYGDCY